MGVLMAGMTRLPLPSSKILGLAALQGALLFLGGQYTSNSPLALFLPSTKFQSAPLGAEPAGPLNSSLQTSVQFCAAAIGANIAEKHIIASKQAKLTNHLVRAPVRGSG